MMENDVRDRPGRRGGDERPYDPYAASRCACGHLFYGDDRHGGRCGFCPCTDHRPPTIQTCDQTCHTASFSRT